MKNIILISFSLILFNNNILSQHNKFEFNTNGEFKIVQFTDLHLQTGFSERVYTLLKEIIVAEKPDLVVLTGDITYQKSVDSILTTLAAVFAEKEQPWVVVLGNHDDEFGVSRKTLVNKYLKLPYNCNSRVAGIKGETNFILPIIDNKTKHEEALLYFFDSNAYNQIKSITGYYDWIDFSQINWYRTQSSRYKKLNKGNALPSLAFFHIPFPEYKTVWNADSTLCIGTKHEDISSPNLNSGLYLSMLECGDVMGTFVGHDHVNDYIGKLNNIALAYGRFSGSKNIYGYLTPGARVIVLKEGKREFETWIREKGGNIMYKCQYPNSFIPKPIDK